MVTQDAQAALETAEAEREAIEREAEEVRCQMEEDTDRELEELREKYGAPFTFFPVCFDRPMHLHTHSKSRILLSDRILLFILSLLQLLLLLLLSTPSSYCVAMLLSFYVTILLFY